MTAGGCKICRDLGIGVRQLNGVLHEASGCLVLRCPYRKQIKLNSSDLGPLGNLHLLDNSANQRAISNLGEIIRLARELPTR